MAYIKADHNKLKSTASAVETYADLLEQKIKTRQAGRANALRGIGRVPMPRSSKKNLTASQAPIPHILPP